MPLTSYLSTLLFGLNDNFRGSTRRAHLETKCSGPLRKLDVLRVIGSVAAAQVSAAERRRLE